MGAFCPSLPVSLRQGLFLSLRLLFFYARLETGKYLSSLYLCSDRSWYYRQVLGGVQLAMWVLTSEIESLWFWSMLFLLMGYLSSLYIFHFRWLVCKSKDYNKSVSILRQGQVFKYCFHNIIICIFAGFIIALLFILWNIFIHRLIIQFYLEPVILLFYIMFRMKYKLLTRIFTPWFLKLLFIEKWASFFVSYFQYVQL